MSVILIKQPQLYTPSDNPIIFQFGTTYSDALYFNIQVREGGSRNLIINDKAYITPVNPTWSAYNLSDVLKSAVDYSLFGDDSVTADGIHAGLRIGRHTESGFSYSVDISVMGLQGGGVNQLGATTSVSDRWVWKSNLIRNDYSNFDYTKFVVGTWSSTQSKVQFLTDAPNNQYKFPLEYTPYYFINNLSTGVYLVSKKTFIDGSISYGSWYATQSGIYSSPQGQQQVSNGNYQDTYLGLTHNSQTPISNVIRTYNRSKDCTKEYLEVWWNNRFGGFDKYTFINPIEIRDVERTTIKKDPYGYNNMGEYSDRDVYLEPSGNEQNNRLNSSEDIINTALTTSIKVWTEKMTDEESRWIAGILEAKQIYIGFTSSTNTYSTQTVDVTGIYPVSLVENSYQLLRQKYDRTQPLQSQFTFKIVGDMLPYNVITKADPYYTPTNTTTTTTTTTTSTTTTTTTTGATSCSSYTISGGGGLGSEWLFALCGSATPSYVGLDSGISLEYCINNNFGLTLISGNGTASAPISCTSSPATTTTTTSTTTTTTTAAPTYDIVVYTSAQSPGGGYICQVWYKIGAGSWVQLSSPTAVTCTGTNGGGTITGITSGTTVYISMTDNSSNDILYAANSGSSACSGSTSYCGISSPYSAVIVANVSVYLAGDSAATTC